MSIGLEIAKTGILVAQRALAVTGNNIVNANTPGYSKRTPILTTEIPMIDPSGFTLSRGVRMVAIERATVAFLDSRIFEKQSTLSNAETLNARLTDLEGVFNELNDFGLKTAISGFFNATQELAKTPDSLSVRVIVVENAKILTQTFNQMGKDIDSMKTAVITDVKAVIVNVNSLTEDIAGLNLQIARLTANKIGPSDLEDQRDVLLNDLSKLIDANVTLSGDGITKNVVFGGRDLVAGRNFLMLTTQTESNGDVSVIFKSDSTPATALDGKLKGLLDFQTDANVFKSELDKLAKALADEFNRIHSEGINLNGSFDAALTSKNTVSNADSTLDTAGLLPFTPSAGDIFITVTDSAGVVTRTKVSIDVSADTLTTVASSLSSVPNLSASVIPSGSNFSLRITPDAGFTFDFSAAVDPNPTGMGNLPTLSTLDGVYTGSANDVFTINVSGAGTIGVTSGLKLKVTDSGSTFTREFDIGAGYVPGNVIEIGDGLKITLSAGSVASGDTFDIDVLNDSDTTNLLSALGFNRFFSGSTANDIAVDADIQNDVSLIAAASNNSAGNNTNALRMADLKFKKIADTNTLSGRTFVGFLADTASRIGTAVSVSKVDMDSARGTFKALSALKDQTVGVSIDEELVNMLKFERLFNASARFMAALNQTIDRILEI
ncbi:MAG: flagellar hook-associated protein FlgK [Candidatus Anammoxibacter sp.]